MSEVGRPTIFTQELADKICDIISNSNKSLRTISKELGIESKSINNWLNTNNDFLLQYARAKEQQADYLAEEILEIADDASQDLERIDEYGNRIENKEFVNRSRLRIDARKWIASKLKPKKYGDKIEATVNASEGVRMILGNKLPGEDEIKSGDDE